MKKIVAGILTALLLLSVTATGVFAAGRGSGFVDADGDGLCDHWAGGRNCRRGGRAGTNS